MIEGVVTYIGVYLLRILWREGRREGSHISVSIYCGSYEERDEEGRVRTY